MSDIQVANQSLSARRPRIALPMITVSCMVAAVFPTGELQAQAEFEGERVVMTYEEPRHRVVLRDGDIILMDVQIQPGDTTLYHTHDSAILYTFISNGQGPTGGNVSSVTSYVEEEYTHRVTNQGPHLFRIIAMANYSDGEAETAPTTPEGISVEPQLENRWFRSYRLDLAPGEETSVHRHHHSVVIVQATDGQADVTREADGFWSELRGMGDWTRRDPGVLYRIRNTGDEPVSVVVNEARRPD